MILGEGTVVIIELDPTVGHEQRGVRPCIVVSDPDINYTGISAEVRFLSGR